MKKIYFAVLGLAVVVGLIVVMTMVDTMPERAQNPTVPAYTRVAENLETLTDKLVKQTELDPVENLPSANAFETKTNPFDEVEYINPFDD